MKKLLLIISIIPVLLWSYPIVTVSAASVRTPTYADGIKLLKKNTLNKASAAFSAFVAAQKDLKKVSTEKRIQIAYTYSFTDKDYQALKLLESIDASKIPDDQYCVINAIRIDIQLRRFDYAQVNTAINNILAKKTPVCLSFHEDVYQIQGFLSTEKKDYTAGLAAYLKSADAATAIANKDEYGADLTLSLVFPNVKKTDPVWYLYIGSLENLAGKFADAETHFRAAIKKDAQYLPAYLELGLFLNNQKRYEESISIYKKAIEIDPYNPRCYNGLGYAIFESISHSNPENSNAFAAVLPYLDKTLALDPEYYRALNTYGYVKHLMKDDGAARTYFKKAIEISGRNQHSTYVKASSNLARLELEHNNYDKALEYAKGAVQRDPKNPLLARSLGDIYVAKKNYSQALSAYSQGLGQDENQDPYLREAMNAVYKQLGSAENASSDFADPKIAAEYYMYLANTNFNAGNYIESLTNVEKSLAANPDDKSAQNLIGRIYIQTKNFPKAAEVLKKALAQYPNDLELNFTFGRMYYFMGEYDNAITQLNKTIALLPTKPEQWPAYYIYERLGMSYLQKKDYEHAIEAYKKSLAIYEPNPQVHYNYGQALRNLSRTEEARTHYQRVFELDPNFANVKERLK